MVQEIAVVIILAAVVIYAGYKVYRLMKGKEKSPCDGCEGCALKKQLKGAAFDCKDRKEKDCLTDIREGQFLG
jgi:hypothetical protein